MATGSVLLPAACWQPGDGSTDNIPPARGVHKGSQSGADVHIPFWGFDGAGSVHESIYASFVMPANYSSGGALKVQGMINSTTGNVARMQAQVSAVTPSDADTPLEHALASAATVDITANTTEARRLLSGDITLTMDSAAAGDLVTIRLFRDPANGSDTHTSDLEFTGAEFSYTTT
jgi:hypothetical protein